MRAEKASAKPIGFLLASAEVHPVRGLLRSIQLVLQLLDLLLEVGRLAHAAHFLLGGREHLHPSEIADEILLPRSEVCDLTLNRVAILHDAGGAPLQIGDFPAMGAARHARAVAAY